MASRTKQAGALHPAVGKPQQLKESDAKAVRPHRCRALSEKVLKHHAKFRAGAVLESACPTRRRSFKPKFFIARAAAPMFSPIIGCTKMMAGCAACAGLCTMRLGGQLPDQWDLERQRPSVPS
eukprot:349898-Chlamydomonas_euryale.AAC.12